MACWIREWALHSEWLSWSNKEALCQTAVYLWRWPFSHLEGHDEKTHSDSETTARGWIVFRHQQTQKLTDGILSEAAEDFIFILFFLKPFKQTKTFFNFCVQQKQNTPNIRYKVSLLHVFPNRGIKNHLVTTNYNGEWIISGPGTKFFIFFYLLNSISTQTLNLFLIGIINEWESEIYVYWWTGWCDCWALMF